jgi:hypothetical protein
MHAYIHTRAHTRTHDVARRILGTRNRTHVHIDAMQPRARSHPIRHKRIHLSIDIGPVYRYISYVPTWRDLHARARSHAQALVATRTHVLHVPTGDPYEDGDL